MRTNQTAKNLANSKKQKDRKKNSKLLKTRCENSGIAKNLVQQQIDIFAEIIVDLLINDYEN
jgi:hypothetical protein